MQGQNQGSGQNSPKQTGLSWTQPASGTSQNTSSKSSAPTSLKTSTPPVARPANINTASSTPRLAGTFIAGLVVGGLLSWMLVGFQSNNLGGISSATTTPNGAGNTASVGGAALGGTGGSLSLSVLDQRAGNQVVVTNLQVAKPTWVVVYDSTNGQPGKALGAKMFFPETNGKGGTITLLRPTVAGKTYLIAGRVDNGDKKFDGTTDAAVSDQAGKRVQMQFKVQ